MSKDEEGTIRLYTKMNNAFGDPKDSWDRLDEDHKDWYRTFYKAIQESAQELSDRIDKEVYSKLVDQENWT